MSHQGSNRKNVVYLNEKRPQQAMAQRLALVQSKGLTINLRQIIVFVGGLILLIAMAVQLFHSYQTAQELDQDYLALKQAEELAMHENIQLQQEYQMMQNPDYLLELARRDYLFSAPGEIVFDLDEK